LLVVLALGVGAPPSRANPTPSALIARAVAGPGVALERVAARRCWWEQGRRHCRPRTSARQTGDDYYVRDADKLPIGTSRWWEEMLRENRAGNPGGGGRN